MRRVLRPTAAIPIARNAATTSHRKAIHPHGPPRSEFTRSVLPIPPYVPAGRSGRVPDTANHGRTNRLPAGAPHPQRATRDHRPRLLSYRPWPVPGGSRLIPSDTNVRLVGSTPHSWTSMLVGGLALDTVRYKQPNLREA